MRWEDSGVLVMERKLKFYCVGQHKLSILRVMLYQTLEIIKGLQRLLEVNVHKKTRLNKSININQDKMNYKI